DEGDNDGVKPAKRAKKDGRHFMVFFQVLGSKFAANQEEPGNRERAANGDDNQKRNHGRKLKEKVHNEWAAQLTILRREAKIFPAGRVAICGECLRNSPS